MNTALLPADAALPQLPRVLDGHHMAEALGAELPGLAVLDCAVDRIKYRPQRNCSVSYRLQLRDLRSGRVFEQRVAARACSGGDAARRHRQALRLPLVASPAGPALSHLPALDLLAFWLPNDARLPALRLLCDDAALRAQALPEVLAALAVARVVDATQLTDHQTTLVQLVPELRVCARVDLRLRQADGGVRVQTLYVKSDSLNDGQHTQAVMLALHGSAAQAQGRLRTPRPLLWQPGSGLHWQLALAGPALQDADPAVGAASSAAVGAALAALHATPVPGLRRVGPAQLLAQLQHATDLLGRVDQASQPLLQRLSRHLQAGAAAWASEPLATLHGDLHPRNVLLTDGGCAFIDLDGVHAGPAVLELGAWIADALYRATLEGQPLRDTVPAWRALLAAYEAAAGQVVDPALLAWSTAFDLLCKRAGRCVANLKPGRFPAVPALLALAERIAGAGAVEAGLDALPTATWMEAA